MPEPLLDQIRSQIHARIRELEPAAREYARLDAALTALGGAQTTPNAKPRPTTKRRTSTGRRIARSPAGRPKRSQRAPRGANRAAALGVLAERPGVSASELSNASGVGRQVLYGLLKRLEDSGEIIKEPRPGGTAGYRVASATDTPQ
jgi:hypothetical protein